MTLRKSLLAQLISLLVSLGYSAFVAGRLPERVPTHWNIHGQVDGWGSKWMNLAMMPGMLAFILIITLELPSISPKGYEVSRSGATYGYVMALVSGMMLALHITILQATLGSSFDMGRVITGVIFVFFALMGNVMGRVKRNYWMGIRTPWTLSDDRVWTATHRAAGKLWFIGGILGAILSIAGVPMMIGMAFLLIISFVPVVQSYFIYRKIGA